MTRPPTAPPTMVAQVAMTVALALMVGLAALVAVYAVCLWVVAPGGRTASDLETARQVAAGLAAVAAALAAIGVSVYYSEERW